MHPFADEDRAPHLGGAAIDFDPVTYMSAIGRSPPPRKIARTVCCPEKASVPRIDFPPPRSINVALPASILKRAIKWTRGAFRRRQPAETEIAREARSQAAGV